MKDDDSNASTPCIDCAIGYVTPTPGAVACSACAPGQFHNVWIDEDIVGQLPNLFRHRCRPEEIPPFAGKGPNNLPDVRKESHIKKPVRFIENEGIDLA